MIRADSIVTDADHTAAAQDRRGESSTVGLRARITLSRSHRRGSSADHAGMTSPDILGTVIHR